MTVAGKRRPEIVVGATGGLVELATVHRVFCVCVHGEARAHGELRKAIPGITQDVLTAQHRELDADGLVSRTVFAEVPPRVEHEITQKARGLGPTMEALTAW